ncbi:MAG TPA: hypothetical protein VEL28_04220 [Candidatus Binatia bacterium]|nr:hypothetical protein [Candidatus Binatia bacterium]
MESKRRIEQARRPDRERARKPERVVRKVGSNEVRADRSGRVREIRSSDGLRIRRGVRSDRVVERSYSDGRRVVSTGRRAGYSERSYGRYHGRDYYRRTYYYGGHRHSCAYRRSYWGGNPFFVYASPFYFRPRFYFWAYTPWVAPVQYDWGWAPTPWYGYYRSYFVPAPVYPTPALWLTDFLIAESLRVAYETRPVHVAAAPPPVQHTTAVALTPEVKQAIAVEVEAQLREQQEAAESAESTAQYSEEDASIPALDPSVSVFVVSENLFVATLDGEECELSSGDVLSRIDDAPDEDGNLQVRVAASKAGNCEVGTKPLVQLADLQEMHNQFRAQVDVGLKKLASGEKGLPAAPTTETIPGEVPPPPVDDVETEVMEIQQEADRVELAVAPEQ